ncbi:MAG: hypothetical protein ABI574_04640 [Burkholderiales bacterium]
MAGGIDWFRWHHGSVTDQKFPLVARRAGASVAEVIAVWACLLERASMNEQERGWLGGAPDFEAMDCALGMSDGKASAIFDSLRQRDLVDEHLHIASWPARQPKRERDDPSAADRKRAQREREAEIGVTGDGAPGATTDAKVTPCDAQPNHVTPRHATSHQKTPRGEESREEENKKEKNPPKPPRKRRGAAAQSDLVTIDQLVAEGVDQQVATDWLTVRSLKNLPLTPTAWDDTKAEAAKAGMTVGEAVAYSAKRSRGGFRASWIASDAGGGPGAGPGAGPPAPPNRQEAIERRNHAVGDEWLKQAGGSDATE